MKKIRVRNATIRDAGLFKKLWRDMLISQEENGHVFKANEKNLEIYLGVFEAYVNKDSEGVVLLVADTGILMWGEGSPFDFNVGDKVVTGWGRYVAPEARGKGISDALIVEAKRQLTEMGFDTLVGGTLGDHSLDALKRTCKVISLPEASCYFSLGETDE
ncbi:MAG: hypothetical protein OSA88_12455 [Acidimicrobiales bacterium]|nr:hypothetical protein [Acidimicrobiales bacterium]